jgi:hypothetical protein
MKNGYFQALTNPKDDSLGRLEIHLIGGFKDDQDCSREVTEGILRACVKRLEKVRRQSKNINFDR